MNDQISNELDPQETRSASSTRVSRIKVESKQAHRGGLVGGVLSEVLAEGSRAASIDGIEYILPGVCCCCGERKGTEPWPVVFREKKTYLFSSRTTTFRLEVLVCEPCHKKLQIDWKKATVRALKYAVVGAMIGAVPGTIIALNNQTGLYGVAVCGGALALPGALVGALIGYYDTITSAGTELARYDGRHLEFKNEEVHRQFVELNPHFDDVLQAINR